MVGGSNNYKKFTKIMQIYTYFCNLHNQAQSLHQIHYKKPYQHTNASQHKKEEKEEEKRNKSLLISNSSQVPSGTFRQTNLPILSSRECARSRLSTSFAPLPPSYQAKPAQLVQLACMPRACSRFFPLSAASSS